MTLNVLDYSPRLWLDASVIDSLILDVNEKVGTWNDLSGSGKHFTSVNAVGSFRTSVVGDGVFFDRAAHLGVNHNTIQGNCTMMRNTSGPIITPPCLLFMAISQVEVGTYFPQGIFFGWSSAGGYAGVGARGSWSRNGNDSGIRFQNVPTPRNSVVSWEFLSENHRLWIDKNYIGIATSYLTGSYSTTYLGAERLATGLHPNSPFKGIIHELIVCGALPDTDKTDIEQYLIDKWNKVISGTVYERNEFGVYVPGAYPVYLYNRATGALVSSTVSAEDGSYTLQGTEGEEYYIMAIDNSSPLQRSAVVDKVVPS